MVSRPQIRMMSSRYLLMPTPKTLNWPCSASGMTTNCCDEPITKSTAATDMNTSPMVNNT